MAYCLEIFGTLLECPSRRQLIDFIREGAYLSDAAEFEPSPEEAASRSGEWDRLSVRDGNRAVVIERHVDDGKLRDQVGKLLFVLPKTTASHSREWAMDALRNTRLLLTLCVEMPSEDDWDMLDNLEVLLLKRCKGILFAPREGIYDADLQLRHRI